MTNKEKLEIIDKKLNELYDSISDLDKWTTEAEKNIIQSIYGLEQIKLLLENVAALDF